MGQISWSAQQARMDIHMSLGGGPLILFYNSHFGDGPNLTKLSIETTCRFTADRRRLPEADAVVFHLPTMREDYPKRYPGQRWVAWSMEARSRLRQFPDGDFGDQFDLTIGFWRDATVWTPYFGQGIERQLLQPPMDKTEPAPLVYFQSSRVNYSGRDELVRGLMRRLHVDSYSKALNNRRLPHPDKGRPTKRDTVARYKFTLALENSIEEDYVTEKFFEPLIAGSVPVYLGAPNIDLFAPAERCFINAADFDGPDALASYLERLCEDDEAYRGYLAWKDRGLRTTFLAMVATTSIPSMRRLCGVLCNGCSRQGGAIDSLSALGRITTRPWAVAMISPLGRLRRRLLRHRISRARR